MQESSRAFMNYLLQNLDKDDYGFKDHIKLLRNILNQTDKYEEIIIDKDTNIISFPYKEEKIKEFKNLLDKGTSHFNEKVLYIKELSMLITNDGMTHRVAALYQHTQEGHQHSLRCNITIIRKEYLEKYLFNPYTLTISEELNKDVYPTDKYFFDYLQEIQIKIVGKKNQQYTKLEKIKSLLKIV